MGIKELAVGRTDMFRIPVADVHMKDGWNVRDMSEPTNIEHVEQLAKSIAEVGQKEPIKVVFEGDKVYVTNGHSRRLAIDIAIQKYGAEIKSILCIPEDRHTNEADRTFTMIASNSGKPLTPLETGRVFKRLVDFGWSERDIASRAGLSGQRIRDLLQLQAAPAEIQTMVKTGKVTATLAQQVMRKHKDDATDVLKDAVQTATDSGKVKATAKHVKTPRKPGKRAVVKALKTLTPIPGGFMLPADTYATLCELLGVK